MFNIKIRINCNVDCIYVVWHAFNNIGQLLPAHVAHAVVDKGYFKCACGVFAHMPVSDFRL